MPSPRPRSPGNPDGNGGEERGPDDRQPGGGRATRSGDRGGPRRRHLPGLERQVPPGWEAMLARIEAGRIGGRAGDRVAAMRERGALSGCPRRFVFAGKAPRMPDTGPMSTWPTGG